MRCPVVLRDRIIASRADKSGRQRHNRAGDLTRTNAISVIVVIRVRIRIVVICLIGSINCALITSGRRYAHNVIACW